MDMKGRVLVVAGSDSGGGAGIQADIKTITALNGFAMTAITALTAQNSLGVKGVHKPPPAFVTDQIRVTLEDLGADAVKTGMMADAPIIEAAADPEVDYFDPVLGVHRGKCLRHYNHSASYKEILWVWQAPMSYRIEGCGDGKTTGYDPIGLSFLWPPKIGRAHV